MVSLQQKRKPFTLSVNLNEIKNEEVKTLVKKLLQTEEGLDVKDFDFDIVAEVRGLKLNKIPDLKKL